MALQETIQGTHTRVGLRVVNVTKPTDALENCAPIQSVTIRFHQHRNGQVGRRGPRAAKHAAGVQENGTELVTRLCLTSVLGVHRTRNSTVRLTSAEIRTHCIIRGLRGAAVLSPVMEAVKRVNALAKRDGALTYLVYRVHVTSKVAQV